MEQGAKQRRAGALPKSGRAAVAFVAMASSAALGFATLSTASAVEVRSAGSVVAESQSTTFVDANFNAGKAGWQGYQEYSVGCFANGVTCSKIDNIYKANGGKNGAGDGYLQFKGNSPAVFPWFYGQASYSVWRSPEFTFTASDAKAMKLNFDWRATMASYAIGWNGIQVELLDSENRVVKTAMPARLSVPTNNWSHYEVALDGQSDLKDGEQYRLSFVAINYTGPSAATLGKHDIDNVKLEGTNDPSVDPVLQCRDNYNTHEEAIDAALTEGAGSFCSVTEPAGNALKPASKIVDALAKQEGIADLLKSGNGAFIVTDKFTGHVAAWAVGRNNIPSSDPRRLYMWMDSGNVGGAADFAVVFVVANADHVVKETFGHPDGLVGAVNGVLEGQLEAAGQVLANPVGEALDVDANWTIANVMWHFNTLVSGKGTVGDGQATGGSLPTGGMPIDMPNLDQAKKANAGKKSELPGLPGLPKLPTEGKLPTDGKLPLPNKELPKLPNGELPKLPAGR